MSLPALKPGDLPRVQTSAERRAEYAAEARANERAINARPNIDPDLEDRAFTRCPHSKYQTHRFVRGRDGTSHCEFCCAPLAACQVQR